MQQDDVAAGPAGQWCDPGPMSWVRVAGRDAVRFVESFTTASVGRVADGGGCEGFFTDVRGQVICMAGLLRCGGDAGGDAGGAAAAEQEPAVEIFADGDVGASLAEHLERYHIREPIEIEDVSAARSTRVVFGEEVCSSDNSNIFFKEIRIVSIFEEQENEKTVPIKVSCSQFDSPAAVGSGQPCA